MLPLLTLHLQVIPHMIPNKAIAVYPSQDPVVLPAWLTISGQKFNTPTLEPTSSTKLFSQAKDACPKDIEKDKLLYVLMMREGFKKTWVLIQMGFKNPEQAKLCSDSFKLPHTTHLTTSANVYGRGDGENDVQDSIETMDPQNHQYARHHCYKTMIGERPIKLTF